MYNCLQWYSYSILFLFCTLWIYRMMSSVLCCTRIVNQNKWQTLLHGPVDVTTWYMKWDTR
jgi:hypothetical protein